MIKLVGCFYINCRIPRVAAKSKFYVSQISGSLKYFSISPPGSR